jgi:hypothetical protein
MKMLMKILITALLLYTIAFACVVVYANTVEEPKRPSGTIFYAYKLDEEPPQWYLPEELGILDFIDYESGPPMWVGIIVKDPPFPLTLERPCFKYKDNYYTLSKYLITIDLRRPTTVERLQFPLSLPLLAWIPAGFFLNKWRKSNEQSNIESNS